MQTAFSMRILLRQFTSPIHFLTSALVLATLGCQVDAVQTKPPALADGMQLIHVGDYQFALPDSFERVEIENEKPEDLIVEIYRDSSASAKPTVVNASVSTDPLAVQNATASPREAVVHFNVGLANAAGVHIEDREETKQLKINGLQLLGFFWTGKTPDGEAAHGLTFGGVDGDHTISFGALEFSEATQVKRAAMMKFLTSLAKSTD